MGPLVVKAGARRRPPVGRSEVDDPLRTLSKQSCKERKALPYEEFKKRICGAAGP